MNHITTKNIEKYRGNITFQSSDNPFKVWDIFDFQKYTTLANTQMVDINDLVSTKNQLLEQEFLEGKKYDARQNAYELMRRAEKKEIPKREPLKVTKKFHIIDGNATAQVLMLLGWKGKIPVEIIEDE